MDSIAAFTYINIHRHVDGNPHRFFLTRSFVKEWDDNHKLHGRVPAFGFAKVTQHWHKKKNDGLKAETWEIQDKIWFADSNCRVDKRSASTKRTSQSCGCATLIHPTAFFARLYAM